VRVLVYAMPSGGASLFACFLAQAPNSIAIVDLWSVAPQIISPFPVIVKATINCQITFEDQCRGFQPDLRILFVRDPHNTYQSLDAKHYKDIRGTILEKLKVLDSVFARRADLFDLVIAYEDLIEDPAGTAAVMRANGLDLPCDAALFPRSPQQIARFAMNNSDWCQRNYLKQFGFGNLHWMDWGTLKSLHYPEVTENVRVAIGKACPLVEEHYAQRRSTARSPGHQRAFKSEPAE
jgi:hypothetical protein